MNKHNRYIVQNNSKYSATTPIVNVKSERMRSVWGKLTLYIYKVLTSWHFHNHFDKKIHTLLLPLSPRTGFQIQSDFISLYMLGEQNSWRVWQYESLFPMMSFWLGSSSQDLVCGDVSFTEPEGPDLTV